MNFRLFYVAACLFLTSLSTALNAFSLSEVEQAYLKSKTAIKMCVDPDWLPFEAINEQGEHIGLAADYMAEYQKLIRIKIELVATKSWSESLQKAKRRECDILSLLNESPERSEYLNFTSPYVTAAVAIVGHEDVLFIDGLSALQGQTLAIPKNYIYEEYLRRDYPEIKVIYTDNQQEAIKLVSSGKVDASIGAQISVLRDIQALGTTNVKVAGFTEYKTILRIGVRKDDLQLLSILSKAVNALPLEVDNRIQKRWYNVTVEQKIDTRLIWQIFLVFLVILLFLYSRMRSQKRFNLLLQDKNKELEKISQTDHLTGIYNRLKTDEVIKAEIARADRYGSNFCVTLFDVDHFKAINDNYGHQVGDEILIELAHLVRRNIRESDILGRWGGEEFMLVTPELDLAAATKLAEKIRGLIEGYPFPCQIELTASFGVVEYHMGSSPDIILSEADRLLYEAKKAGRNRVLNG